MGLYSLLNDRNITIEFTNGIEFDQGDIPRPFAKIDDCCRVPCVIYGLSSVVNVTYTHAYFVLDDIIRHMRGEDMTAGDSVPTHISDVRTSTYFDTRVDR